jgi:hypothetical protein
MSAKKHRVTQEPLLSTVARKLGYAAGTLTKVTQELADNVSAVPETVAAKVRHAVKIGESAGSAGGRIRHARKKLSRAIRSRRTATVAATTDTKRRSPRRKVLRRKARASKLKN